MNAPSLRLDSRQHHALTPRLQQAVRLLQLSSLDFAQEVREAISTNPFLEPEDDPDVGAPAASAGELHGMDELLAHSQWDDQAQTTTLGTAETDPGSTDTRSNDKQEWERDNWHDVGNHVAREGGSNLGDLVASERDLRQHLQDQMDVWPLSEREHVLVTDIIGCIDDDGYLRTELEELAALSSLTPPPDLDEMRQALALVQSLDPYGIGARSVSECLQLQLPTIENEKLRELARIVLTHYLDRLAHRDIAGLAKLLSCKACDLEAACERIRHFDPRPGWRIGSSNAHFITPDVIVRQSHGEWYATLNPAVVPRVRINQMYADLFQQHRNSGHAELAASLQEARWTVRNVEQRFSTILLVTQAILKRQHQFLEYGPLAMKPLGLREIAEEVGLHESTVCRVTNNKYMATPVGVFELKYFFSRSLPTASGGSCSATAIRGVIKDMIAAEDPAHPLSDAAIAKQLATQGLPVARRTVTKYRQMLKFEPVDRRRRHPV